MLGPNEAGMGTGSDRGASGMRDETTIVEHRGRVESADASSFKVKEDDDGETYLVDKKAVFEAEERGEKFEVGARVAFTTSLDGSEVLSLRKCDRQATKSA